MTLPVAGSIKADSVVVAVKVAGRTEVSVEARLCGQHWYSATLGNLNSQAGPDIWRTTVLSLSPYTCYQFRSLQHRGDCRPLQSPPSESVQTLSSGQPSSPPTISSIRQLPRLNINITFDKPSAANGKM